MFRISLPMTSSSLPVAPTPSHLHRESLISISDDSIVSLSLDSENPTRTMAPERGLIAYVLLLLQSMIFFIIQVKNTPNSLSGSIKTIKGILCLPSTQGLITPAKLPISCTEGVWSFSCEISHFYNDITWILTWFCLCLGNSEPMLLNQRHYMLVCS